MLRRVKELHGDTLCARDGEIGRVDEILFDDMDWMARYLVVDTSGWIEGRKVLIAAAALGALDWEKRLLTVNLTRDQVEASPGVESDAPVSRQFEKDYHDYYSLPYYWGGVNMAGVSGTMFPSALLANAVGYTGTSQQVTDKSAGVLPWSVAEREDLNPLREGVPSAPLEHADIRLRSTHEVTGYAIIARDGRLGHVEDFIVDDETWRIRYMAVDTHNWWPGKKVLLLPDWIDRPNWPDRTVTVKVTREQVCGGPEWHPNEPISPSFEDEIAIYYARQPLALSCHENELEN